MTLNNIIVAIDKALDMLRCTKFCYLAEDEEAYYITACGDNGERIVGSATCRVDKQTMECEHFYHTDKRFFEPRKEIQIPQERKNRYISIEDYE